MLEEPQHKLQPIRDEVKAANKIVILKKRLQNLIRPRQIQFGQSRAELIAITDNTSRIDQTTEANQGPDDVTPAILLESDVVPQPEVSGEEEIDKIRELRQFLGLPEKSPLLLGPAAPEERKRVVDAFLQERLQTKLAEGQGFIDRNKAEMQKMREIARTGIDERTGSRRVRTLAIQALEKVGIKNAGEYIAVFEERGFVYGSLEDIPTVITLRKLGVFPQQIGRAVDRLAILGFRVLGVDDLKQALQTDSRFRDYFRVIAETDESIFQTVCQELNQQYFLQTGKYRQGQLVEWPKEYTGRKPRGHLNHNISFFANVLQQGGLTNIEKDAFDVQLRMALLGEQKPNIIDPWMLSYYINEGGTYGDSMKIDQQLVSLSEKLVYQWLQTEPGEEIALHRTFFSQLKDNRKKIKILLDNGVPIPFELQAAFDSGWGYGEFKKSLDSAANIASDQTKLAWVTLLQELHGEKIINPQKAEDLEELYTDRQFLADVAVVGHVLPDGIRFNYSTGELFDSLGTVRSSDERFSDEDKNYLEALERFIQEETPGYVFGRKHIDRSHFSVMAFLARHKGNASRYIPGYFIDAPLIEELAKEHMQPSDDALSFLLKNYFHPNNSLHRQPLSTDTILKYHRLIEPGNLAEVLTTIPNEEIERSPHLTLEDQSLFYTVKKYPEIGSFIIANREKIGEYFVDGNITPTFCLEAARAGHGKDLVSLLTEDVIESFPDKDRQFWSFLKGESANNDLINFYFSKPEEYFFQDGQLQEERVMKEFVDTMIVTPERCTTYNNLTRLLTDLATRKLPPNLLATTYLRIAAAHKKWQTDIDSRTEIEEIEGVKLATANLFHGHMTPAEKLGWTILRRQLPFTANEAIRGQFRTLALRIEGLDTSRLGWVHQSVHNYASIHEPEYLRALQVYLEIGDQSKLEEYRTFYTQDARAPEYTDTDRQTLLHITELPEQLNQLIALADEFYTIRPEMLRTSRDRLRWVFEEAGDTNFVERIDRLREALSKLNQEQEVSPNDRREAAWVFLTEANNLRKSLLSHMAGRSENTNTEVVILDTVLDELFQKTATQYINDLQDQKEAVSPNDIIRSVGILSECIRASNLNGEIDNDVAERSGQFTLGKDPRQIDNLTLHNIQLLLPVVEALIESDWKTFAQTSLFEMTTILRRAGMTEKEAQAQVAHVDLVELKKTTTLFVAEPLIKYLKDNLTGETLHQTYDRLQEDVNSNIKYDDNVQIDDFIRNIRARKIPDDPKKASEFLTTLASSQEAQAEILARAVVPNYQGRYIKFEKDGTTIEIYPFSHYGKLMIVIIKDGVRVENSKDFLMKEFGVIPAVKSSLREGD